MAMLYLCMKLNYPNYRQCRIGKNVPNLLQVGWLTLPVIMVVLLHTELFAKKNSLNALYDIPKLRFRYISSNTRIKNSKIPGNHIIMTSYWRFAKQDWVAWCQQKKHEWVFSLVFEKARTFNVNNLFG